jgi:hypothetical protein
MAKEAEGYARLLQAISTCACDASQRDDLNTQRRLFYGTSARRSGSVKGVSRLYQEGDFLGKQMYNISTQLYTNGLFNDYQGYIELQASAIVPAKYHATIKLNLPLSPTSR